VHEGVNERKKLGAAYEGNIISGKGKTERETREGNRAERKTTLDGMKENRRLRRRE
jgi:hypothetical protein